MSAICFRSHRVALATVLVTLLGAAASAQEPVPENAPIPRDGVLVETDAAIEVDDAGTAPGLPGVGLDGPQDEGQRGPGGLSNGVGAIGTTAPSTSGYNPVPLGATEDRTGVGIPLTAGPGGRVE